MAESTKDERLKPLRIDRVGLDTDQRYIDRSLYVYALGQLAIAEAMLVKANKQSAYPHFLAIVKELEKELHFEFNLQEDPPKT